MVTKYGMSKDLGPLTYGDNEDEIFLGRSDNQTTTYVRRNRKKEWMLEVKKIVDVGYQRAKKILTEKLDDLHKLAKALT